MKNTILIFLAFLPLLVFSQKNFEGIITYKVHSNEANKDWEVKLFLSEGRMKAGDNHSLSELRSAFEELTF